MVLFRNGNNVATSPHSYWLSANLKNLSDLVDMSRGDIHADARDSEPVVPLSF